MTEVVIKMFQGLVKQRGAVLICQNAILKISPEKPWKAKEGDSVAINGVCLTVSRCSGRNLTFELGAETLLITSLETLERGEKVNLERPLRFGEPIHGHLVLGHVETKARVIRGGTRLSIAVKTSRNDSILHKGCLSVDGVSLTVNRIQSRRGNKIIEFCLIPETLKRTNLKDKKPGDWVNVETDYLVKILRGAYAKNNQN